MIPQCDPKAGYLAQKDEIDAAIARVLDSGWYVLGEELQRFEEEFAVYTGTNHAVGVASGTDALQLALQACGVEAGDEVITVSHTAVATIVAIERTGAIPVLVDVSADTYGLDVACLAGALSEQTRAVVPVHLYGLPCDMSPIMEFAARHGLRVVEDCAQAHGATYRVADGTWKKVGSMGDAGAFSFYPTKNLGGFGDGGAVTTNSLDVAERVRVLRQYGWRKRYISDVAGMNSRLDEIQAAVLRVGLVHLDESNAARQAVATIYDEALNDICPCPRVPEGRMHVYHQYVVRLADREIVKSTLRQKGVGTAIHYPVPVHQQPAYSNLAPVGALPVTESVACEVLSLPMCPSLAEEEVRCVVAALRDVLA